jgi:flavin-dependent dehydrogenase
MLSNIQIVRMNYIIIGAVAGGASTAARLRRMDEKANIILFEKTDYISYANCGLPYYIARLVCGVISLRGFYFKMDLIKSSIYQENTGFGKHA